MDKGGGGHRGPGGRPDEAGWLDTLQAPLGPRQRQHVYGAMARAAYAAQTVVPVVDTLVCDDAGQFVGATRECALCWVHDARHDKKLLPVIPENRAQLLAFMTDYWAFYQELLVYREQPPVSEVARLRTAFITLFSPTTGDAALDARIANTRAHQQELLVVLAHPELPLHNTRSALGARRRVRKRDVRFGPRTPAGATAWDTLQTLAATAQQHGVNVPHYFYDRVSGAGPMPRLASLIAQQAASRALGASWDAAPAAPSG